MSRLNWHQAVLLNMVDAVIALDDRKRIMLLNPAAERLFGQTLNEIQGQPFFETVHFTEDCACTEMQQHQEQVLQTGEPLVLPITFHYLCQMDRAGPSMGKSCPSISTTVIPWAF